MKKFLNKYTLLLTISSASAMFGQPGHQQFGASGVAVRMPGSVPSAFGASAEGFAGALPSFGAGFAGGAAPTRFGAPAGMQTFGIAGFGGSGCASSGFTSPAAMVAQPFGLPNEMSPQMQSMRTFGGGHSGAAAAAAATTQQQAQPEFVAPKFVFTHTASNSNDVLARAAQLAHNLAAASGFNPNLDSSDQPAIGGIQQAVTKLGINNQVLTTYKAAERGERGAALCFAIANALQLRLPNSKESGGKLASARAYAATIAKIQNLPNSFKEACAIYSGLTGFGGLRGHADMLRTFSDVETAAFQIMMPIAMQAQYVDIIEKTVEIEKKYKALSEKKTTEAQNSRELSPQESLELQQLTWQLQQNNNWLQYKDQVNVMKQQVQAMQYQFLGQSAPYFAALIPIFLDYNHNLRRFIFPAFVILAFAGMVGAIATLATFLATKD